MSRTKLILLILVLVGGAITAWLWSRGDLSEPPEAVYRRMIASAEIDFEDGFVDGFSVRSRPVARALLKLADVYGFDSRNPLRMLAGDDALHAEHHGDRAIVWASRHGVREHPVLFMKDPAESNAWRVDLSEYERFLSLGRDHYFDVIDQEAEDD